MNWNQPSCNACWVDRHPSEQPQRIVGNDGFGQLEMCAWCGVETRSGIYVHAHPSTVIFPAPDRDDTPYECQSCGDELPDGDPILCNLCMENAENGIADMINEIISQELAKIATVSLMETDGVEARITPSSAQPAPMLYVVPDVNPLVEEDLIDVFMEEPAV